MNGVDIGEDQTLMIRWSKTISVKGSCLNQYEIKKSSALTFLEIEGGSDIVRGDVESGE